jgi:diacylglycerol kinase family enzyme
MPSMMMANTQIPEKVCIIPVGSYNPSSRDLGRKYTHQVLDRNLDDEGESF